MAKQRFDYVWAMARMMKAQREAYVLAHVSLIEALSDQHVAVYQLVKRLGECTSNDVEQHFNVSPQHASTLLAFLVSIGLCRRVLVEPRKFVYSAVNADEPITTCKGLGRGGNDGA